MLDLELMFSRIFDDVQVSETITAATSQPLDRLLPSAGSLSRAEYISTARISLQLSTQGLRDRQPMLRSSSIYYEASQFDSLYIKLYLIC